MRGHMYSSHNRFDHISSRGDGCRENTTTSLLAVNCAVMVAASCRLLSTTIRADLNESARLASQRSPKKLQISVRVKPQRGRTRGYALRESARKSEPSLLSHTYIPAAKHPRSSYCDRSHRAVNADVGHGHPVHRRGPLHNPSSSWHP